MGWNKTDVEGRIMWERNGVRVSSTDQIEAIEKSEQIDLTPPNWCEDSPNYDSDPDSDERTPWWVTVIYCAVIIAILFAISR